ncbi:Uma2 family endonuclease [Nostoc sp. PCC 9305]|uniref:Uma2 family endonuclease n=1 Tax=Nostoc sp. PCC 9305 TaxID=296636 RepID=UPI0039C5B1F0
MNLNALSLSQLPNRHFQRELKFKLYSSRGIREYWIVDWRKQQVQVYRREQASLKLVATLFNGDKLSSPILPDFTCAMSTTGYAYAQLFN